MQEDKLTRQERIRLEALAQANAENMRFGNTPANVLDRAKNFETFILTGMIGDEQES